MIDFIGVLIVFLKGMNMIRKIFNDCPKNKDEKHKINGICARCGNYNNLIQINGVWICREHNRTKYNKENSDS